MHDPRIIAMWAVHDGMFAAAVLNDSFGEASLSQKGRERAFVRSGRGFDPRPALRAKRESVGRGWDPSECDARSGRC
jgi:hypothetical protein